MGRVVHCDETTYITRPRPGKSDECLVAPVSAPRGTGFQQLPSPILVARILEAREQCGVERGERPVRGLRGSPSEVYRYADLLPLALPLVEEAQPGCEEGYHGGRPMHGRVERRRGTRLVVILEEAREAILEVEPREQMLPDGTRRAVRKAVV